MHDLETRGFFEVGLELRQDGREMVGSFPYRSLAVVNNVGRVRKERFMPGSFTYSIEREDFDVSLLSGHSFDRPLASKLKRTLTFNDSATSLEFRAVLPVEGDQPSWVVDTVKAVRSGLAVGVSPGFRIPPASSNPNAVRLVPEPGNESVSIREIHDAIIPELSIVTRAAYVESAVSLRSEGAEGTVDLEDFYRWL